ncbi:MAG: L-threonylcarbamoyladenylate synthase [Actinomycetota bacterium]|nr:L-threonylcarbamoyladenylate synthase [Actinomycetota bacterium]
MTTVDEAARALRSGSLAVIPTDTVYGLAAHLEHPEAIEAIFEAKARPPEKPLPILGADLEQLMGLAEFDERASRLAERFWPGPLTMILPRSTGFTTDLGGDDHRNVGVRVPKEPRTLELLRATGPLAVTSANRSGDKEAMTVDEARTALGDAVSVYLDGGRCVGVPSTIVFLAGERRLLREGTIPASLVTQILSE